MGPDDPKGTKPPFYIHSESRRGIDGADIAVFDTLAKTFEDFAQALREATDLSEKEPARAVVITDANHDTVRVLVDGARVCHDCGAAAPLEFSGCKSCSARLR